VKPRGAAIDPDACDETPFASCPREFREERMPLMIGVSQTVEWGATPGFEYLRLEPRPEGVFYVAVPSGKAETAMRLEGETVDKTQGRNDAVFTFVNPKPDVFPERIIYRRATEGWLCASVEGKVGRAERMATDPMRRINCESGEFIAR
jgi:hypothetical protein